jgi:caffeoyl-CoA O-methyltransferase
MPNDTVKQAITACAEFIKDRDDALALPPEAAEFAYLLVRATGARRGVEIGTSLGYSGLWIGAGLAENVGRLITIDIQPEKTQIARGFYEQAGLGEAIRCEVGRAEEILAGLEGPFDFVLNDADKENCQKYVELLLPKLVSGAVILTDNSITHARELASFVAWARQCPELQSVHLPMGNGFEMSVRR